MKFRIFGTILVLAILGALYMVTEGQEPQQVNPAQPVAPTNDSGLQPLKIN